MTFNFKLGYSELGPQAYPKNWADGTLYQKMAALQPAYWRIMCDWDAVYSSAGNDWNAYALTQTVLDIQKYCPNTQIIMIFGQKKPSGWSNASAQTFVTQMVQQFAPLGVTHYECWNEPNSLGLWGGDVSATAYVGLLQAMYAGVKAVLPGNQSTVIFAGMQHVQFVGPWVGQGWETQDEFSFLRACYAAATKLGITLGSIYDKMATHVYPRHDNPHSGTTLLGQTVPCTVNNGALMAKARMTGVGKVNLSTAARQGDASMVVTALASGEGVVTYYQPPGIAGPPQPFPPSLFMDNFRQLAGIIGLMQANGDGGKGLWITESGLSVYDVNVDAKTSITDTNCPIQCLYTQQTFALLNMFSQIEVVIIYNGVDTQTGTKDNGITGYGTMTNSGGERQLYIWLLSLVQPSGGGATQINAVATGLGVVGPALGQSGVVYARTTGSGVVGVPRPGGTLSVTASATGTGVVGVAPAQLSSSGSLSVTANTTGIGKVNATSRNADLVVTATALGEGAVGGIGGNTSVVVATATGAGTVAVSGNEVGVVGAVGGGSLSVTATASGTGTMKAQDSAALVVTASATGSGTVTASGGGAGGGSLSVTANATGVGDTGIQDTASLVVTASSTGSGVLGTVGAGPDSITATGSGVGVVEAFNSGSATVIATATGTGTMHANDSAALVVTASATGSGVVGTVGTGSLSVTATGSGTGSSGIVNYNGGGSQTVTATATGTGAVGVVDTASEMLSVTANGTGAGVLGAVGTGSLSVTATGTGVGKVPPVFASGFIRNGFATVQSPTTGTIPSYTPAAGDLVTCFVRTATVSPTWTVPTGWTNPLGGTTLEASGSDSLLVIQHVVTSAEQTAGTTSWTLTGLFSAGQTGAVYSCVVRGANSSNPIDTTGVTQSSTATTTHVLAGITPNSTGSLVIHGIGSSGSGAYSSPPAGTTLEVSSAAGQNGGAIVGRTAATTAGVAIGAANITFAASSQYASITLAIAAP